jgi:hypothetical protein
MANMSYVAFENTSNDLDRCINLLTNEVEYGEKLSNREFQFAQAMLRKFREYEEAMQELVQNRSDKVESSK